MTGGPFRFTDRAAREAAEEQLAPAATRAAATRGRVRPEAEDPLRTAFERDRDRILHAKAFRRLKHKTQVFLNPDGDHFVTRLTHTLQVTQVARSLARALGLNETLAEAIALGHDVGHSPSRVAGGGSIFQLCDRTPSRTSHVRFRCSSTSTIRTPCAAWCQPPGT